MGPMVKMLRKVAALLFAIVVMTPKPCEGSAFGIPEFLEFGECSDTKNMVDLDINRYSGVWFAQEMVPNEYSQIVSCSMTNYTWRTQSMMKVVEKGITAENRKVRQNSIIRQDPERDAGNYVVEADGVPSAPFQIVDTDYDNYACVHSCMEFMGFKAAFSWIYTRKPDADHSYVVHCRESFTKMAIDPTPLQPMKQGKGCPYMDKIHHILSYSESVQTKAKMAAPTARPKTTSTTTTTAAPTTTTVAPTTTRRVSTTSSPSEETLHELEITLIENDLEHAQELEKRLLEEEEQMQREMEAARRRQEEERRREEEEIKRMEEERQREEEERRRMEEERRLMEEERKRMEEERAIMEEETRREKAETREEAEQLEELRDDVRAEIRRNHRGSKHRTEYSQDAESSTSGLSTSVASILLTVLLSVIFSH